MTVLIEPTASLATPMPPTPTPLERSFLADDGARLFYRAWLPRDATAERTVLLFHRGHEHSGRLAGLAAPFVADGFAVFAWDARGHGRSPGPRGYASDFAQVVRDVDDFARHVSQTYDVPLANTAVVAHSVAAVAVAAWVHDYAPPVRALVLATPALRVKLYGPLAVPALRLLRRIRPDATVTSYVRPGMLTHDREQADAYRADPLVSRGISVRVLLGLHDTATRLIADAAAIETPTLLMAAGQDYVVKNAATRRFFERLGSARKELRVYDRFRHAIFHEAGRERVIADAHRFITAEFERPVTPRGMEPAAFTRAEHERLSTAPSRLCPKAWSLCASRLAMRTVGRLSEGVRLGWRAGFDSGESLDYVYRNEPRGVTAVGRMIDRSYLNAVGWVGIRQRRAHLERTLREAMEQVHAEGLPVNILDVASGPGRYVLESIRWANAEAAIPARAVLRDRSEAGLAAGRALAAELGVRDVKFETGDAFDPASAATASPAPSIAIVSGLYELFPDNQLVLRSLRGLCDALLAGGILVYTNQPWHPQVEFIARVLTNRDGEPWVMRRRTQAEMDALVRAAGFEKVRTRVDDAGIFTVSVARKGRALS